MPTRCGVLRPRAVALLATVRQGNNLDRREGAGGGCGLPAVESSGIIPIGRRDGVGIPIACHRLRQHDGMRLIRQDILEWENLE
jgi:hypothetical protein